MEQILKALAGGVTVEELLEDYPELEREDIQAALVYASELVNEEQVLLSVNKSFLIWHPN